MPDKILSFAQVKSDEFSARFGDKLNTGATVTMLIPVAVLPGVKNNILNVTVTGNG